MTGPRDYHDYVFRDGRLVGDFDAMYRDASEIPWHQDVRATEWWVTAALALLDDSYTTGLDVGCGLGYVTARIAPRVRSMQAMDVSPTAVATARTLHGGIHFFVSDLRHEIRDRRYDLVVAKDVLWYVTPWLDTALGNLAMLTGRHLWLVQTFPRLDQPFVGQDVIPTPEALLTRLRPLGLQPVRMLRMASNGGDGPTLAALLSL